MISTFGDVRLTILRFDMRPPAYQRPGDVFFAANFAVNRTANHRIFCGDHATYSPQA
jgi:hypothetical protein